MAVTASVVVAFVLLLWIHFMAVFAVNGTFLAGGKIWAASFIFLRTCALTTSAITTSTRIVCCVFYIVPFTAIRAEVGAIQKSNNAS